MTADINPRAREFTEYRESVRQLCAGFDSVYWQRVEEVQGYPEEFVAALTQAGWLAALIPTEYGGGGLGVTEASVILEEINRSGANSGACHAQMYIMGTLLRHGSAEQKARYLPKIASGELRLQSFAVTEPTTGTDTTKLKTVATRRGDRYVVNGQKVWISRVQHSDLMLLLARTTPAEEVARKSDGLSVFLVELDGAISRGMTLRPIRNMVNHETNEVFFDNFEVPSANLIGEEGKGFSLHPRRHERRANSHCRRVHRRRVLVHRSCAALRERTGGLRPADRSQPGHSVSHRSRVRERPLRRSDALRGGASVRRGRTVRRGSEHGEAARSRRVVGSGERLSPNARRLRLRGEYDVERKFRETRLYQVAPISTNLILSYIGEHRSR
jgi:acyl-CoA dehydrogenase